jgi:hypothetical protein
MRSVLILALVLFCTSPALSQQHAKPLGKPPTVLTNDDYVLLAGNETSMWISNNGALSHNPMTDGSGFEWPAGSAKYLMYAEGLVIGARQNGVLRVGGATYRYGWQAGNILPSGFADDPANPRHRVYRVRRMTAQEYAALPYSTQQRLRADFLEWPVDLGAPWIDRNSDGVYTPDFNAWLAGSETQDAPAMRGREMCWYVANDLSTLRTTNLYGSMPMGLEVQVLAWTGSGDPVSERTVYTSYTLINKGNGDLSSCYIGRWADPDLGDARDDLVGIDTVGATMYAYNGKLRDAIYGTGPPAVGVTWLQTAMTPSPGDSALGRDGWRDGYRNVPLSAFAFYINSDPVYQDPDLGTPAGAMQMYRYLMGRLYDGSEYTDPQTGLSTRFPLAGNPGTGQGWIDGVAHLPDDRRMLSACGPLTIAVGDTQQVVFATTIGTGDTPLLALRQLMDNAEQLQQQYRTGRPILSFDAVSHAIAWPAEDRFTLHVDVRAREGQDLAAMLRDATGSEVARFTLYDDGQHGDGDADDGHYCGDYTEAARANGADLCVALLDGDAVASAKTVAHMLPLTGNIRIVDLDVVSDHFDFDGVASPGENILLAFTLENHAAVSLGPWSIVVNVTSEKQEASSFPNVIERGASHRLDGLQMPQLHALQIDVPGDVAPNTVLRIPITVRSDQYCLWQDTLKLTIRPASRPMYTGELQHETGPAVGTLAYTVSDPEALNGHLYRITVQGLDHEQKTLKVEDVTAGTVLHSAMPLPEAHGHWSPEIGGCRLLIGSTYGDAGVTLEGAPTPALRQPVLEFENAERAWFEPYADYLLYGDSFFGSAIGIFDSYPVLLIFDRQNEQKGYLYLRGTSPDYSYGGYFGSPLTLYDMRDLHNPRQISYAFVEVQGSAANDYRWFPTISPGDREYFFPLDDTYSEIPSTAYTQPLLENATDMPMLYGLWPVFKSSSRFFQDGDKAWIRPQLPMTMRDEYLLDGGLVTQLHDPAPAASAFSLHGNYPNPFSGSTTLSFTLTRPMSATLLVTDALGREVARLIPGQQLSAGTHTRVFMSSQLSPGVYYCRLIAGGMAMTRRMVLLR